MSNEFNNVVAAQKIKQAAKVLKKTINEVCRYEELNLDVNEMLTRSKAVVSLTEDIMFYAYHINKVTNELHEELIEDGVMEEDECNCDCENCGECDEVCDCDECTPTIIQISNGDRVVDTYEYSTHSFDVNEDGISVINKESKKRVGWFADSYTVSLINFVGDVVINKNETKYITRPELDICSDCADALQTDESEQDINDVIQNEINERLCKLESTNWDQKKRIEDLEKELQRKDYRINWDKYNDGVRHNTPYTLTNTSETIPTDPCAGCSVRSSPNWNGVCNCARPAMSRRITF